MIYKLTFIVFTISNQVPMTVSVHMLSGEILTVSIGKDFLGLYRIRNLRNDIYDILRKNDLSLNNSNRLIFSKIGEDESLDDYDFIEDDDNFRVFVTDPIIMDPIRVRMTLADNNVICLRREDGFLVNYYGWDLCDRLDEFLDDEPHVDLTNNIILVIDLSDEAYDIMREDIRLAKEAGEENDDSDEEDEPKYFKSSRNVGYYNV